MALVTATDGEYGCIGTKSVALICVDSLEAYCPKFGATGSFGSNPEVFAGSLTNFWHPDLPPPYWWLPGDYELPASQALKVFYKYVKDGYGNVLPFDLVLRANLLPDGISDDCILYNWTKRSGPGNSGSFVEMDKREVRFRNPTQGGLYKFRLSVSVPGGTNHISEAWVLLPKAGGEVSDWLAGEVSNTVQRALAWKSAVEQVADAYGKDRRQFLETAWKQIASWDFDYQGVAGTPTPRYSFTDADRPANHVPDENIPGMQGKKGNGDWDEPSYATLEGVVVHRAKINNLMYAVWGRTLGYSPWMLKAGAYYNAISRQLWDDSSSQDAIEFGCDLYDAYTNGIDLSLLITRTRAKRLQSKDNASGLNDVNLWPDSLPVTSSTSFWIPTMPTNYEYLVEGTNTQVRGRLFQ